MIASFHTGYHMLQVARSNKNEQKRTNEKLQHIPWDNWGLGSREDAREKKPMRSDTIFSERE